jgi:signal transduction histidine kinase
LLAGISYSAMWVASVLAGPTSFERIAVPGWLDGFIGYSLVPTPFALFAAYLGRVVHQLEIERDRGRQALAEARALAAVTASGLRSVTQPHQFVAETVVQVRRRARLRGFAIIFQPPRPHGAAADGNPPPEEVEAFGPVHGLVAAVQQGQPLPAGPWPVLCLPLDLAGRHLGTLVAQMDDRDRRDAFLTQLAGQVAAALTNAHLYAEAEALAAQAERARLAREIHDGIAQSLFMLTLNLEACMELVERDPDRLRERLEMLVMVARQTLWQTRHYIHDLKPLLDQQQGLRHAIENQIKEFRTISGLAVELTITGDEVAAAPAIQQALYRITQEGLANVFKHAGARHVAVDLTFDAAGARLVIEDDGRGFGPDAVDGGEGRGFGLGNMRERTEELGGQFSIRSEPGQGARLETWVPYQVVRRRG